MADSPSTKPATASKRPSLVPQAEHAGKPAMPLGAHLFTMIGSRNRAHLHLLSSTISRNHAGIVTGKSGVYIRDLASRNGVIVNGRKLRESELQDGDLVQLGSFKFKFQEPAGPIRLGTAPQPPLAMIEMDGHALTPMDERSILIGRRPGCDITLDSPAVSNTHAIIFECDGKRFVRDLGSRTGTQVNGKTIHQQAIEIGDRIKLGSTTLRYVAADLPAIEDQNPVSSIPLDSEAASIAEPSAAPVDMHFDPSTHEEPAPQVQPAEEAIPLIEPAAAHSEPVATNAEPQIDFAAAHPADDLVPIPVEEEIPFVQQELTAAAPSIAEPAEQLPLDVWMPEPEQSATADVSAVTEPQPASHEPVAEPPAVAEEIASNNDVAAAEADLPGPEHGQVDSVNAEIETAAISGDGDAVAPWQSSGAESLPLDADTDNPGAPGVHAGGELPADPQHGQATSATQPLAAEPEAWQDEVAAAPVEPDLAEIAEPSQSQTFPPHAAEAESHDPQLSVEDFSVETAPWHPVETAAHPDEMPAGGFVTEAAEQQPVEMAEAPSFEPEPSPASAEDTSALADSEAPASTIDELDLTTRPIDGEALSATVESETGASSASLIESPAIVDSTELLPGAFAADSEIPDLQPQVSADPSVAEETPPIEVAQGDPSSLNLEQDAPDVQITNEAPPETEPEPSPLVDSVAPPPDQLGAKRFARTSRRKSAGGRSRRKKNEPASDATPAIPEQDLTASDAAAQQVGEGAIDATPESPATGYATSEAAGDVPPESAVKAEPYPVDQISQPAPPAEPPLATFDLESAEARSLVPADASTITEAGSSTDQATDVTQVPAQSKPADDQSVGDFALRPADLAEVASDESADAEAIDTVPSEEPFSVASAASAAGAEPLPIIDLDTAELPAPHGELPATDEAAVDAEAQSAATTHTDFAAPIEDIAVSLTAPAVETLEGTDPTPESALDLEPSLPPLDMESDAAEVNSAEALLSDSAFGEVVTEFASQESGPLVEESGVAPAPLAAAEASAVRPARPTKALSPLDDSDLPPLELGESLTFGEDIELPQAPDEDAASDELAALEQPVAADSTAAHVTELEFTAPVAFERELDLQPASDLAGDLQSPVSDPPSFDAGLEWEEPLPNAPAADEIGLEFEESPAGPQMPPAARQGDPSTPRSEAPPAPPARQPMNPFFGMERDLGSFIGGMPLALATPAPDAPTAKVPPASEAPTTPAKPAPWPAEARAVNDASKEDLELERLFEGEEPLELFDETSDQLDKLPDTLEPISDLGSAIGEPSHAAPAVPRVTGAPAPTLRSLTADPSSAVVATPPATSVPVPPFAGAARQGANPFAGLGGLRPTDVFSQTAFPPMDEPATNGPAIKPQPIDVPPMGPAKPPGGSFGPLPGSRSGGPPLKTDADAIASAVPAPRAVAPRPTAAMLAEQPSQKRPWWKNARVLLPLLLVLIAAAVVAIIRFLPPKTIVQGTLQIKGIDEHDLGVYARREQVNHIRQALKQPGLRDTVLQRLKSEGIAAGFVQDPRALGQLADPSNSPFEENRLVLQRQQTDPQDPRRMEAVLEAVYFDSKTAAEQTTQVRQQATVAAENLQTLSNQVKSEQDDLNKTADQLKATGGSDLPGLLTNPVVAVQKLERQDAELAKALAQANADRKKAHDNWEQAQDAAQQGGGADPRIAQIRQNLSSLNNRLTVAHLSGGAQADPARAFDDALGDVERDLTLIAAANSKDPTLSGYVASGRRAAADIRSLLEGQKQDAARIEELRQQLAAHREARLRQVFATDETLKGMVEEREAQAHRFAVASDSGYAQDAARIRGVLDELDQKIDARRQSLAADAGSSDELQQKLEQALAQQQDDRHDKDVKITAALGRLDLPPAGKLQPSDERMLDHIGQEVATAKAVHEQYASGRKAAATDADAQVQKLQSDIAEQQAQLDAHEQRNDSKAAVSAARQALDAAQNAEAGAQAAYAANLNLLTVARTYRDEQMRVNDSTAARDAAAHDAQARAAEAGSTPILLPPDPQNAVRSISQPDQRVWYLVGAIGLIVLLFAGPLWMSLREPREEIPYAAMSKHHPAVVEDDEHFPTMDDDEHPALT